MRAVGIRAFGGPIEQLELPDPPEPGRSDVLVDVLGAGIGNWDDLVRTGAWTWASDHRWRSALKLAGIVRAIGFRRESVRRG